MVEMTEEQRQACWDEMMAIGKERYPMPDRPPLGAKKLQEQNPHGKPKKSKRGPAPSVRGTCPEAIDAWKTAYHSFVTAYRDAWESLRSALKRGVKRPNVEFPAGGVPPTNPMPLLL